MLLINFSHPLPPDQLSKIEKLTNQKIEKIIAKPVHFNHNSSFAEQISTLVDSIELTFSEWQTKHILINPPSFAPIAVVLLAHLHGRCGYFPAVLRLRPIEGSLPPQYEVAEVLDLQAIRDRARLNRA